jgi:hypothetical protein
MISFLAFALVFAGLAVLIYRPLFPASRAGAAEAAGTTSSDDERP